MAGRSTTEESYNINLSPQLSVSLSKSHHRIFSDVSFDQRHPVNT